MKNILVGITLLIAFGCISLKEKDVVGIYESKKYNRFEKVLIYLKYDGLVYGTKLKINKDSSFVMQTCGNYIEGKWNLKNDSIYLKVETNIYRSDSLNSILERKEKLKKSIHTQHTFKNKNNSLLNVIDFHENDEKLYYLEKLIKK